MKVQIAACLLCMIIAGGTLDRLPDPPAIKPQPNQKNLVTHFADREPVAARNHASDRLTRAPHFLGSLLSFGQIFESKSPSYNLTFVRQATDTSPPCFS
jgi:hypothetical protein